MRFEKKQFLLVDELEAIVNLHLKILKDSVLTRFGKSFLRLLYQSIVSSPSNVVLVAKDQDQITAFLVATANSHKFYRDIVGQRFFSLIVSATSNLLKEPRLFFEALWWLIQPKNEAVAQLQFLAVAKHYQHQGLGIKLIKSLNKYFKQTNINTYVVGTRINQKAAHHFYLKNGFQFLHSKKILGEEQNFYLITL